MRVYFSTRAEVEGSTKQKPTVGFYDGKGRMPTTASSARRSSSPHHVALQSNRMYPVLHVVMPHSNVDYAGATGTPIFASAAGTVISAGDSGPCGTWCSSTTAAASPPHTAHM